MASVLELPPADRPRERLRSLGAHALTTTELLTLLIGTGSGSSSAADSASKILARAGGSLRKLGQLPVATLASMHGLGEVKALAIHAALEIGRRLAAEATDEGEPMRGPRDVWRFY